MKSLKILGREQKETRDVSFEIGQRETERGDDIDTDIDISCAHLEE